MMKLFKKILVVLNDIFRFFIIYIPGPTGRRLRYLYYKKKFKSCGKNVLIDEGIIIQNPSWISIGDNVWIDKYSVLIAGPINVEEFLEEIENKNFKGRKGELIIGNEVHIGAFNIIQALGGVSIGNRVTTSAGVKIYSLSNSPYYKDDPQIITYANCMVEDEPVSYIISPIVIEDGVWIALNSIILGGIIGAYSFIASNSLAIKDIPKNSYAKGFPAERIKERFNLGGHDV